MTRDSILEYAEAIRGWYPSVSRKEKGTFLGYSGVTFRYVVGPKRRNYQLLIQ